MVLQRRFVRSKGGPLCDPVMLLDANSSYAHVRHSDGRETTCQRLTTPLVPVLRKTSSFRVISREWSDGKRWRCNRTATWHFRGCYTWGLNGAAGIEWTAHTAVRPQISSRAETYGAIRRMDSVAKCQLRTLSQREMLLFDVFCALFVFIFVREGVMVRSRTVFRCLCVALPAFCTVRSISARIP